jgi:hypothetical protein
MFLDILFVKVPITTSSRIGSFEIEMDVFI